MQNDNSKANNKTEKIFRCGHCGNRTSHLIICTHSIEIPLGIYSPDNEEITADDYYFLFECKTCKNVSLKNVFSEELDGFDDPDFDRIHYLYPSSRIIKEEIPDGLNIMVEEAKKVKAVSVFAYIFLVRKVLEELCIDKGIKGKNLKEMLNKLVIQEKLPEIIIKAVDKLRLLGNIGAHQSKLNINKVDIELVEEFMLTLIEYVYVLPTKLDKLDLALKKQRETK